MFPKNREAPQNGWFIMENLIKMDDLGVYSIPIFLETPIFFLQNPTVQVYMPIIMISYDFGGMSLSPILGVYCRPLDISGGYWILWGKISILKRICLKMILKKNILKYFFFPAPFIILKIFLKFGMTNLTRPTTIVGEISGKTVGEIVPPAFWKADWNPFSGLHSLKLTSPVKGSHPKRKLVFQPSIFRCYVSFREGIPLSNVVSDKHWQGLAARLHSLGFEKARWWYQIQPCLRKTPMKKVCVGPVKISSDGSAPKFLKNPDLAPQVRWLGFLHQTVWLWTWIYTYIYIYTYL